MRRFLRAWLLVAVVSLLAPLAPIQAQAGEDDAVKVYGCTVAVLEPELVDGDMVARVDVDCLIHLRGRTFRTTLQQRDSEGSFRDVRQVFSTLEAPNVLHGSEGLGEYTTDSMPIRCRPVDGTEEFRTFVTVRGGKGNFTELSSAPVEFSQDCLGGDLETVRLSEAEINAAGCTLAPISNEEIIAGLDDLEDRASTTEAVATDDEVDLALEDGGLPISELPAGAPASATVVAEITTLEESFAACYNLGELRRLVPLFVPDLQVGFAQYAADPEYAGERWTTPYPYGGEEDIPAVVVSDVRMFADGRAGAVVDWEQERNFHIYELIDGQWAISGEISIYG